MACPPGWVEAAHRHWGAGHRQAAIDAVLAVINGRGPVQSVEPLLQLAYYIYFCGDPGSAAQVLSQARRQYPQDKRVLQNLALCLGRSGQHQAAIRCWDEYLAVEPDAYEAFDALCHVYAQLGQHDKAREAGARALALKDRRYGQPPPQWRLPQADPAAFAGAQGKRKVVAFALWGNDPRYLRGALDNALAAPTVYPGWELRFHVDRTVPEDVRQALLSLGAMLHLEPDGQSTLQRLTWRFKVADDPGVGWFVVRDVDSVVGARERRAVDEWMASGRWFHVMRDWWTHTDLMLAGMWGGVAGVLPSLAQAVAGYQSAAVETPNIDQWFLRDVVWRCVRQSCCVHDRCFPSLGARPWPGPTTEGIEHVGQDMYTSDKAAQEMRLGDWLQRVASLTRSA